jgi:site-specific recombinase XerC
MLLDRIHTGTIVGLRDRALLGVMIYSFARVSAVVGMRRQDYFPQGKRWVAAPPREESMQSCGGPRSSSALRPYE